MLVFCYFTYISADPSSLVFRVFSRNVVLGGGKLLLWEEKMWKTSTNFVIVWEGEFKTLGGEISPLKALKQTLLASTLHPPDFIDVISVPRPSRYISVDPSSLTSTLHPPDFIHVKRTEDAWAVADPEGVQCVPWNPSFKGLPLKISVCANVLHTLRSH